MNTGGVHGSALGADEVAATKKVLGFDPDKTSRSPSFKPLALVWRRTFHRDLSAESDLASPA